MKGVLLSLLFILCCLNIWSQQFDVPTSITFRLPGIFNVYNRDLGVGVNFQVANRLLFEIGTSIIIKPGGFDSHASGIGIRKARGFIIQFDPKYIVKYSNDNVQFIGMRLSYNHYKYNSVRARNDSNIDDLIDYNVVSNAFNCGFIYGVKSLKNFNTELSIGLGFRVINIKNDASISIDNYSELYRLNKYLQPEGNGWYFRPNVVLGGRLGLNISNKH